uniref:AH domain-containing protein n=1 Tax=Macrostomum lignano TaxID=282301 RepID=A0A1I8F9C3_9PLAT
MNRTAGMFFGLMNQTKSLIKAFYRLSQVQRVFGEILSEVGVKEPQPGLGGVHPVWRDSPQDGGRRPSILLSQSEEMDDEEYSFAALQEPLYRVETGIMSTEAGLPRCAMMCLVKIELLDNKHVVQDTVSQLQCLVQAMSKYHNDCCEVMKGCQNLPNRDDLNKNSFQYESTTPLHEDEDDEDDADEPRSGVREFRDSPQAPFAAWDAAAPAAAAAPAPSA